MFTRKNQNWQPTDSKGDSLRQIDYETDQHGANGDSTRRRKGSLIYSESEHFIELAKVKQDCPGKSQIGEYWNSKLEIEVGIVDRLHRLCHHRSKQFGVASSLLTIKLVFLHPILLLKNWIFILYRTASIVHQASIPNQLTSIAIKHLIAPSRSSSTRNPYRNHTSSIDLHTHSLHRNIHTTRSTWNS